MPQLRRFLGVVALVCLILFLLPGYAYDVRPERSVMSVKLGLPFSPWVHLEKEHTKTADGEKNSMGWRMHFLSWSSLVAAIGLFANWGAKRLREKKPDMTAAISSSNPVPDRK
jgi:hypothetical protein